jgi:glycosyltransferase involved in cell wall biosynthesis
MKAAKAINLEAVASPGDVLCTLGAPWHDPKYEERVARCTATTGVLFSLLVHDLIPLLRPEYFELGRAPHFERVISGILPLTDTILTNSRSTAADVTAWASAKGIRLKKAPSPIPIGTGFMRPSGGQLPSGLETGRYILFVSTIEARKNHLQAFRIWCRLLRELPRDAVPTLVFAGSWGWMVDDLRKAIEATNYLNGKLQIIISPDDATLAALYRGCKFTLYLSYYEGWGLPVSDSLSFGKLCVASERTSIPEAGGSFSIYVDPDNTTSAYETIRALVTGPQTIERLEAELMTNYRPIEWSETAHEILRLLLDSEVTATIGQPVASGDQPPEQHLRSA